MSNNRVTAPHLASTREKVFKAVAALQPAEFYRICARCDDLSGREVDRALQWLRKQGRIEYVARAWRVVRETEVGPC